MIIGKATINKIMAEKHHKKTACCSEELCAPSQSLPVCAPLTQWLSSRGGANSWNLAFFFHLLKHTWQTPSPASFITHYASNFSLGTFISSCVLNIAQHILTNPFPWCLSSAIDYLFIIQTNPPKSLHSPPHTLLNVSVFKLLSQTRLCECADKLGRLIFKQKLPLFL